MTNRRDVLAAIDGSADASRALEWAIDEARAQDRGLTLMHAVHAPYSSWSSAGSLFGGQLGAAQAWSWQLLNEAGATAQRLSPETPITARSVLGSPVHTILREAGNAAEVVLGARGHSPLASVLTGRVSLHVATHALVPAVVVRPSQHGGMVIVGLDGSHASSAALAFAVDQAVRRGVPLLAVHACGGSASSRLEPGRLTEKAIDPQQGWRVRQVEEEVRPWAEKHPHLDVRPVARRGHPVDVLLELTHDAQLLVIGSHGHSVVGRLLVGSVAVAALQQAECSVAVVRPDQAEE